MTVSRFLTMRNTAGAILSLLAFGVVWPSGAQAGCHYSNGPSPWRGAAYLELLAQAGALSVPIDEAYPPAPVPPCAGIALLERPGPGALRAPAVVHAAEQWGYLTDFATGPDITSSPLPCDDPAVRPRHRGVSPFHPPR